MYTFHTRKTILIPSYSHTPFPPNCTRTQLVAFARTLGESTGKATQRKRVPFVAFAKGKPKVPATAAVRRVSGGKGKLSSSKK